MYKCPGCGAALRFDPEKQMIVCDHCGKTLDPKDEALQHENEAKQQGELGTQAMDGTYQAYVYMCPNCGAKVLATDETAVTFCSFCGSNVVLDQKLAQEEKPDIIIPFKISKKACESAYRKVLGRALFAPSDMKKSTQIEKFRGIYMPYWVYDYSINGPVSVRGEKSHRSGDYIIKENYRVDSDVDGFYGGLSYDASASFSDALSEAVAPFNASQGEEFMTTYMSGFYADLTDVNSQVYAVDASKAAARQFATQFMAAPGVWHYGVSQSSAENALIPQRTATRKGYFPVWFLANRSANGKYISYAVVNGETGKVAADLPVSMFKYILAVLIISVPIAFLLWFLIVESGELSLTPTVLLVASAIVAFILMISASSSINKAYLRQNALDDKGVSAKEGSFKTVKKAPSKERFKYMVKPVIALILPILMLVLGSSIVSDVPRYVVAIISLILLIFSVLDLVLIHNKGTRQKLAQFNKRGGDFGA